MASRVSKSGSSINCSNAVLCSMWRIGHLIQSFSLSSISAIPAEFTSKNRPSLLNQQSLRPHTANQTSHTYSTTILCTAPENPDSGGSPLSNVFRFSSTSVTSSAAVRVRLVARTDWLWHLSAFGWTAEQRCYSRRDIDSPFAPAPWSRGLQRCIFGNLRVLSV